MLLRVQIHVFVYEDLVTLRGRIKQKVSKNIQLGVARRKYSYQLVQHLHGVLRPTEAFATEGSTAINYAN